MRVAVSSLLVIYGNREVMIFTIFTLAGIGLCIAHHRGWGIFCFLVAAISLIATI